MTPNTLLPFRHDQRRSALLADVIHVRPDSSGELPLARHDVGLDGVGRALSDFAAVKFTPLIRVCAVKGMNVAPSS